MFLTVIYDCKSNFYDWNRNNTKNAIEFFVCIEQWIKNEPFLLLFKMCKQLSSTYKFFCCHRQSMKYGWTYEHHY